MYFLATLSCNRDGRLCFKMLPILKKIMVYPENVTPVE